MTEEARRLIDVLRQIDENDCEYEARGVVVDLNKAADLIESLSAQLDQVTRERDAAVEIAKELNECKTCKHDELCKKMFPNCQECENTKCPCRSCRVDERNNWQWRGVEVEG